MSTVKLSLSLLSVWYTHSLVGATHVAIRKREDAMYIGAMVLSGLMVIFSAFAVFLGYKYLTGVPQGGHEGILYAVGMLVTLPAVVLGLIASLMLRALRQKGSANRIGVRLRWLPLCLPVLVVIALNVMLLFK